MGFIRLVVNSFGAKHLRRKSQMIRISSVAKTEASLAAGKIVTNFGLGSPIRGVKKLHALDQWFLTLLKVLNPAYPIHAFTEPFVIRGINHFFDT